jgi:hypothetical protein
MYCRFFLLLGYIFLYWQVYAQANTNQNAYSLSFSGATVAIPGVYSITENQGGMGYFNQKAIALNYSNRYMLSELAAQSAIYLMPLGKAGAGVIASYFGSKELNESCYSIAYGRQLFSWLGAGIKMNYHNRYIEAVDIRAYAITGEIGVQAFPLEGFCVGVSVMNPAQSHFLTMENDVLYAGLKVGISYTENEYYSICAQFNRDNFIENNLAVAGEYWFLKVFAVRAGLKIRDNPSWSFGSVIKFHKFQLDMGFENHTILGLSAALSIIYTLKGDAK